MNPPFFSKNHAMSRGVASGTICTIIHVLNLLFSILLIWHGSPQEGSPPLPPAPLPMDGWYAPTKISPDISN
jgi:hypothetical protein